MMLVKFFVIIFATCIVSLQAHACTYDVLVYGATASGVMAAIAASEEGSRVLLVEPGKYVGGMVTGGLSHSDYGDRTVIG